MKPSYWMRYNKLLIGNPYDVKKKGRKPKLQPFEYAAYMAYMTMLKGAPFRAMEFESELCNSNHIGHSTFVVNFEKIPVDYYIGLAEYDDGERKKYRSLVEPIFGGLTNAGLMVTRLKKKSKILCYGAIILLRHNMMTINPS